MLESTACLCSLARRVGAWEEGPAWSGARARRGSPSDDRHAQLVSFPKGGRDRLLGWWPGNIVVKGPRQTKPRCASRSVGSVRRRFSFPSGGPSRAGGGVFVFAVLERPAASKTPPLRPLGSGGPKVARVRKWRTPGGGRRPGVQPTPGAGGSRAGGGGPAEPCPGVGAAPAVGWPAAAVPRLSLLGLSRLRPAAAVSGSPAAQPRRVARAVAGNCCNCCAACDWRQLHAASS